MTCLWNTKEFVPHDPQMQPLPSDHGGQHHLEKDMALAVTIFSNLAATLLHLGWRSPLATFKMWRLHAWGRYLFLFFLVQAGRLVYVVQSHGLVCMYCNTVYAGDLKKPCNFFQHQEPAVKFLGRWMSPWMLWSMQRKPSALIQNTSLRAKFQMWASIAFHSFVWKYQARTNLHSCEVVTFVITTKCKLYMLGRQDIGDWLCAVARSGCVADNHIMPSCVVTHACTPAPWSYARKESEHDKPVFPSPQ